MGSFEYQFEQMKAVQNQQLAENMIKEYSFKDE